MKILLPTTLSLYFIKQYGINFLILLFSLLSIIYIFDVVELLRRAASSENLSFTLVLVMGLYKLPEVGQMIFPFAILFSAMWTFWQLTKHHELVIVRSAGLSAWQFILPIILTAFFIGILQISLINPLGAVLISKYENLETKYLDKKSSSISISEQGLWLRQDLERGKAILHADKVSMPAWTLQDVTVFFFDENNNFTSRVDAGFSYLKDNHWYFKYGVLNQSGEIPRSADRVRVPSNLSVQDLESSFASPETISFWQLPDYIKIMERTGFDSTPLKIHFQSLMAKPLLFIALILLAASVSLKPQRVRGTSFLVFSGIIIGFVIFFMSSFLEALGASAQMPIYIVAWFPAVISLLLGVGAMMVLEDG